MKNLKTSLLVVGLIFFNTTISLAQQKINQYDLNGKRNGHWEKHYNNNNIRYKGQFNHGKEVGVFKYFSPSNTKIPIIVKTFNPNNNTAQVKYYGLDGKLESVGEMDGTKRIGKWLYYHTDGKTVMSEENYINGKLSGIYKTYFSTGKLTELGHYKDGLLNGNYKKYSIKGFLYQDLNYIKGKLNGLATYYNRITGKIITRGTFNNDKRVGTWRYYKNGKLVSTDEPALKNKKKIKQN